MFEKAKVAALEKREVALIQRVTGLIKEKDRLLDSNEELKVSNKRLQIKKEMEEEQIAHKLAMREQTNELKFRVDLQVAE